MSRIRLILLVSTLAVFILVSSCVKATEGGKPFKPSQTAHIGDWTGKDDTGAEGIFVFGEDGKGKMIQDSEIIEFTYSVDYTKKPIWLDMFNADGMVMKCIIEFIDADTMRMRTFVSEVRPEEFVEGPSDDTIVLRRVQSPNPIK